MAMMRARNKAAREKMKAQLKLAYEQKKAEKQSGSGQIIPDKPAPPPIFFTPPVEMLETGGIKVNTIESFIIIWFQLKVDFLM